MADLTGILQAAAGNVAAAGEYEIERSLRFNSADSAYLDRTFASAGNRKTWTWSGWVKRTKLTQSGSPGLDELFVSGAIGAGTCVIRFNTNDTIRIYSYTGVVFQLELITSAVFRDVGAWYHIVLAVDTTQATNTNRAKLYVNGTQVTALSTATYPTQNDDLLWNQAIQHSIGSNLPWGSSYADCYMTEINFIDGQALTPSSFGEFNADTGVWSPIEYTGTYGTNGFYLNFSDNTSTTTLGDDLSGNGNDWTTNNFSVTAGAGNDSLVDSPTRYGTDTGAGGEVRGNYCTLNSASPLATGTLNGNLQLNFNATNCVPGTLGVTTGKWYWEGLLTTQTSNQQYFGVANSSFNLSLTVGQDAHSWGMTVQSNASNGKAQHNNTETASYATFANGDICMVAYDMGSGKIWFGRNGTFFNSGAPASGTGEIYSNLSGTIVPMLANKISGGGVMHANFGQRPFAYTAPSGFKALVTTNLPDPTVVQGDEYFNTVLYTGTGSSLGVTGVGFQPDWVWIKERSGVTDHGLYDAVRGVQNQLESNTATAETTEATGLTAFGTDGFTVGALAQLNTSADTYVAWNWKANGAGVSNGDGTISSTVSVSTTSGFSIVTWTNPASGTPTIGHGLSVAPAFIIVKDRTFAYNWDVGCDAIGWANRINLNATDAAYSPAFWNSTAPTSTVFTYTASGANSGDSMVAYCFAPVAGFSAFGSYTGNASTDGPFIFTGFRPRWIMIKRSSSAGESWFIHDTSRSPNNVSNLFLAANLNFADTTAAQFDILSNGIKIRESGSGTNTNTATYIFAAFAENPFKFALAR